MASRRHQNGAPVVLSEGAGIALSTVFNKLVKPRASDLRAQAKGKRPRSENAAVILAESEEVQDKLTAEKEEVRKNKESKRAKIKFENNGRVIPDAATGAVIEKELLGTATKGAVALFNAVSKARKNAVEKTKSKSKKSGPSLSREGFMDMIRAGVGNADDDVADVSKGDGEESDSGDEDKPSSSKAKWLKDDFFTSKSKKPKDWNAENNPDALDSSENDEDSGEDAASEDSEDDSS